MELLNQPINGQLGNRLIELLNSSDYRVLNVIVAFAKNSGVLRIKDALQNFRDRGGQVNVYLGIDLGGTSYEALTNLLNQVDSLNVIHSENGQTFHTKIYDFVGDDNSLIIIGSHNLTGGGLWTNFESSAFIPIHTKNSDFPNLQDHLEEFIQALTSLGNSYMPIKTQDDIDSLLDTGYVMKEVLQRVRLIEESKTPKRSQPLFGRGITAGLPRISTRPLQNDAASQVIQNSIRADSEQTKDSFKETMLTHREKGQTMWFETRKMTGGSRNILDLSKKSLVEHGDPGGTEFQLEDNKYMRGGVEFFGLDPSDTTLRKSITINFEGADYEENVILFPEGDNANGTWRLQFKGADQSGRRLTEAFKLKGEKHYLTHKIVAFTRVEDDYFFMSVFPASELQSFKSVSTILARNGLTPKARQLGLL